MATETVPYLQEKFEALAQSARHPGIATVEQLRVELALKKGVFRKYTSDVRYKDRISGEIIERICRIFAISRQTLLLDDIEEFRETICDPDSVMQELLNEATIDKNRLQIILSDSVGHHSPQRGVSPVLTPETLEGEHYPLHQRFSVQMQGPPRWSALLLLNDPDGWQILDQADVTFTFPNTTGEASTAQTSDCQCDYPKGQHTFLGIFTLKPLDSSLIQRLCNPAMTVRFEGCSELVRYLSKLEDENKVLIKLPFGII